MHLSSQARHAACSVLQPIMSARLAGGRELQHRPRLRFLRVRCWGRYQFGAGAREPCVRDPTLDRSPKFLAGENRPWDELSAPLPPSSGGAHARGRVPTTVPFRRVPFPAYLLLFSRSSSGTCLSPDAAIPRVDSGPVTSFGLCHRSGLPVHRGWPRARQACAVLVVPPECF